MKLGFRAFDFAGFILACSFAVYQEWSLQEFCWSTWLAGLCYSWLCIVTAGVQLVLTASSRKAQYEQHLPMLQRLGPNLFFMLILTAVILAGILGFRIYSYLFGFYGLFLSVFSEMEPLSLFGRNGFINSDFFTPVTYLLNLFWPMVLGTITANARELFSGEPWKRLVLPFQSEILRIHLLTIALPFISILTWFLFRDNYQTPTIFLLMGIFYLAPKKHSQRVKAEELTTLRP